MSMLIKRASETSQETRFLKILFRQGSYYRVWPYADQHRKEVFVSIGSARSFVRPMCKILRSTDRGNSWNELCDFTALDPRNTTTGQPFVTREGAILICTWDVGFYQYGKTWLAIYRSEDRGETWQQVFCNPEATYGNHFFQSSYANMICLGVGIGGGGHAGKVSCTPSRAILMKSEDGGMSWKGNLSIELPTPLYDGIFVRDSTSLVTARDINTVYRTEDGGGNWEGISVPSTPRCIAKIEGKIVISSDSSIIVSSDEGRTWTRYEMPIRNLMLRYPIEISNNILMSAVGWRSLLVFFNCKLRRWHVAFDVSKQLSTQYMARMAVLDDSIFLGDEVQTGSLARLQTSSLKYKSILPYVVKQSLTRSRIETSFEEKI